LKNIFKIADSKEHHFYELELYPFQDEVLSLINDDLFYLSGGTCLSRFYYNHRYSDDLDFFFDGYYTDMNTFKIRTQNIINKISNIFKTEISLSSDYFIRLIIYKNEIPLKIEFIFENYKNIGVKQKINNFYIDAKDNIAVNKITTIFDRKTIKDYVDLYYLIKDFDLNFLIEQTKTKVVPVDYETLCLIFNENILEGQCLLKKEILLEDFNNFRKNLIKGILENAKK
jgi:predicted nucleotidyltransferase component of viral defense system